MSRRTAFAMGTWSVLEMDQHTGWVMHPARAGERAYDRAGYLGGLGSGRQARVRLLVWLDCSCDRHAAGH